MATSNITEEDFLFGPGGQKVARMTSDIVRKKCLSGQGELWHPRKVHGQIELDGGIQ